MSGLSQDKAYIFRITHVANVPWMLDNGLHCRNSADFDPNFRTIGSPSLIQSRHTREVPIPPGGTLSDYVPFYFTPWSIMMFNIKTGYAGVKQVPNEEIVILVSSLHTVAAQKVPFIFTNQHAYPVAAEYFNDLAELNRIDWPLLVARDFKHNPEDPGKKERYQAEALIHRHMPVAALHGIGCHGPGVQAQLQREVARRNLNLPVAVQPSWYF